MGRCYTSIVEGPNVQKDSSMDSTHHRLPEPGIARVRRGWRKPLRLGYILGDALGHG